MSGAGIGFYRERVASLKSSSAKLILAHLCLAHRDGSVRVQGFGVRRYAKELGMDRNTVRRGLEELLESGAILISDGAVYLRVTAFDTLEVGASCTHAEGDEVGAECTRGWVQNAAKEGASCTHIKKKKEKDARELDGIGVTPRALADKEARAAIGRFKDAPQADAEFAEKRALIDELVKYGKRPETSEEWRQVWAFVRDHEDKARDLVARRSQEIRKRLTGE